MSQEFENCPGCGYPIGPNGERTKVIGQAHVHLAVEMVPTFSHTHFSDVKSFNQKFGLMIHDRPVMLTKRKLVERAEFMFEELREFCESAGLDESDGIITDVNDNQDLAGQADALVDLVYVALGTAVMLGLPWQDLWDDVQRANMAKVRGETKRGHRIDCRKPEGWVGPKTGEILKAYGFHRIDYTDFNGAIDEELCHDDK